MSKMRKVVGALALAAGVALLSARPALAQAADTAPGRPVSTTQAMMVVREALVESGFTVVRVSRAGDRQLLYFRAVPARGAAPTPVERIVISPDGEGVRFEGLPAAAQARVNARLRIAPAGSARPE